MGCTSSHQNRIPIQPLQTVNGILKVTIEQARIQKPTSKLFDLDPYLILRMSNQQFKGYIHKKAGRQPFFNQSFQFIINSCYKQNGRSVEIQLWDECKFNDQIIGIGAVDIDPIIGVQQNNVLTSIINKKSQCNLPFQQKKSQNMSQSKVALIKNQCKMKIYLSKGLKQTCFLNTLFQFFEQPIQIVGFKFFFANLRRQSSIFTTMNCWVQVIAGQQVLGTHKQKDKQNQDPPSWRQQILRFNIPISLKQCLIRVMDDQNQIGKIKLPFQQIVQKKGQHHFTEQIQDSESVTGILKFTVSVGIDSVASQMRKQTIISQMKKQPKIQFQTIKQPQKQIKQSNQIEKQFKMEDSYAKTAHYTHANQQQNTNSRMHTLQNSRMVTQN